MPIFPFLEAAPATSAGAGIIHFPHFWAGGAGYEYWIACPSADLFTAAAAGNPSGLDGWGWVATSISVVEGATGDFMSAADMTPTYWICNAAGDLLRSPRIFGGREGALAAAEFLGDIPTKFILEFYAAFLAAGTNENTTYIGLGDGANAGADCAAVVYSNGANFVLGGVGVTLVGAAVDTAWHTHRIEIDSDTGLTEWLIDGVSQGFYNNVPDVWPQPFKMLSTANNDIACAWCHGKYEL